MSPSNGSNPQESGSIVEINDPKIAKMNRREVKETANWMKEHKVGTTKLCSACYKEGYALQKCSRCKAAWYCSKECQKSDWSTHKQTCQPFTSEGISLSYIVNKFSENQMFWLYLQVYLILALDLIRNPLTPNAPSFEAWVLIGIEPPDVKTFLEIFSDTYNANDNPEGMLQINDIVVFRELTNRPVYRTLWEKGRHQAVANGFASDPVGVVVFYNEDSPEGITSSIRISSEAREIVRAAEPFTMTGALTGTYTKPFTAMVCLEWVNRYIRQDRQNRLHLRRKMTAGDIKLIRDAGKNSDREAAKRLRMKVDREDVYKVYQIPVEVN